MKKWEGNRRLAIIGIVLVGIVAAMLLGNVFLGRKLAADQKALSDVTEYQHHIAMIGIDPFDDFWKVIYAGALKEGEQKDMYIENFGANLGADYTVEDRMQMAIASKVDGIVLEANGGDKMKELIDQAKAEDIPVMTILNDVPNSGRVSFVSGNDYTLGELYGKQIIDEVRKRQGDGNKIKVTVLVGSGEENAAPNLIYSGIRESVSPVSAQIELSTVLIDSRGEFQSEETIRKLMLDREYPQVLVTLSALDTIRAYQSAVDYNMVGKITLIGYHSSQDILEMIQKGIIKSTVAINAEEMGQTVADGMGEYLSKEYVSEYLPVTAELIDSSNVDKYIQQEKMDGQR